MKNKKILIISIVAIILAIVCGVCAFLYYQNMNKNQEGYDEAVKKYERIENVAKEINNAIDKKITPTQDFIATKPDVRRR